MSVEVKKLAACGAQVVYYGVMGADGIIIGGEDKELPSAGDADGNAMKRLYGVQNFPFSPTEAERQTIMGDDGPVAKFQFAAADFPEGEWEMAINDLDFNALTQGTLVDTRRSMVMGAVQPKDPETVDMCIIVQGQGKRKDPGETSISLWHGLIIPVLNVTPRHRDAFVSRGPAKFMHSFISNLAAKYPWGEAFSLTTGIGAEESVGIEFHTLYPMTCHTFLGNGTVTDWNLDFIPATEDAENVVVAVDGVEKTYSTDFSLVKSTKVLSFNTAPATDEVIVIWYGHSI